MVAKVIRELKSAGLLIFPESGHVLSFNTLYTAAKLNPFLQHLTFLMYQSLTAYTYHRRMN